MTSLPPGIYRHYKNNDYEVFGVAVHTETGEEFVVYRALYGEYRLCVRPKAMFLEDVHVGDYAGPRFRLVHAFFEQETFVESTESSVSV